MTITFWDFPDGSDGKECACNAGYLGLIPGWGRSPGEGDGYPLQYSRASLVAQMVKNLPGESRGQRSLVGYSPWDRKELDTTEQLSKA